MENSDQVREEQVRQEFRAKYRARMIFTFHLMAYIPAFFAVMGSIVFAMLDNYPYLHPFAFVGFVLWTILMLYHMTYYYYKHGKGQENREARIMAEVQRRKMLAADAAKFKNNDADYDTYALTDDGELFEYAEDELKQKYQA